MILVSAMHITAGVFINDDEPRLHADIERWVQKLAPGPAADDSSAGPRLPAPPQRRGQRRRAPQEPAIGTTRSSSRSPPASSTSARGSRSSTSSSTGAGTSGS
jgi:hypothetical protein